MGRKATSLPRGLSRVDHENSNVHLWRVQKPEGAFLYFGDATYGGKAEALRAALLELRTQPVIGIRFSRFGRNTTGIIGVSPLRYRGRLVGFRAICRGQASQTVSKTFLIRDYGEEIAFQLAVQARRELVEASAARELEKRDKQIARMLARLEK